MNIEITILEAKLEVKRKLAEKCERRVACIPGRPQKGQTPGGNTRKRTAISQVKKYAKQVRELEILIAKLKDA